MKPDKAIWWLFWFGLAILLVIWLTSCYTERKAKTQFGKAVTTFPKIGSDWAKRTYPPTVDTVKIGTTEIKMDTIYVDGIIESDTVKVLDTVRITKTVQLPAKVITKTIVRVDTVETESTKLKAAFDNVDSERKSETERANKENAEKEKFRSARNSWRLKAIGTWIGLGILGLFLLWNKRKKLLTK